MRWYRRAVVVLAAIAAMTTAARAQGVRLERPSEREVNVAGSGWRLRYGTTVRFHPMTHLVTVAADRAFFAHGPWLRLLDTSKGTVVGRWRFPSMIEAVSPTGGMVVDVRLQLPPWAATATPNVRFDPAAANPPDWDVGALLSYRTADWEVWELLKELAPMPDPWAARIGNAADHVATLQDMVTRDPAGPMWRLGLAKLLRDAGDPRADAAFADVFRVSSQDFTEWFHVTSILSRQPGPEQSLASDAFERAMADFIRRNRDPRMVDILITRLVLLPPGQDLLSSPEAFRRSYLDRAYALAPTGEATERAWAFHAEALAAQGEDAAAALWRERAATSSRESLFAATIDIQKRHDQFKLVLLGSILAAFILIATRHERYAAQRRMHALASARSGRLRSAFFGLAYWSRRERWTLLAIVVVAWLANGESWSYARVFFHAFGAPVRAGSFNSFEDFARAYPPTPERNLLHGLALQMQGMPAEAERRYRSVPQFAESWNNIGVILSASNRVEESRQAFERALQIDPALPEALLNATGKATSHPTELFQKYAQDKKMIALPGRERLLTAYLGSVWTNRHLRSLLGPLDAFQLGPAMVTFAHPVVQVPALIGGGLVVLLFVLALVLIAFVPLYDVSVAPGGASRVLEVAIPGTAPVWRWAGGAILLTWSTFLLTAILQLWLTTPYLLLAVAQPGIMRAFGYQTGLDDINPPLTLVIGVVAALWIANAVLLRVWSRR